MIDGLLSIIIVVDLSSTLGSLRDELAEHHTTTSSTTAEPGPELKLALLMDGAYLTDWRLSLRACGIQHNSRIHVASDKCWVCVDGLWSGRIVVALSSTLKDLHEDLAKYCNVCAEHLALSVDARQPVEWTSSLRECGVHDGAHIIVAACSEVVVTVVGSLLSSALRVDPSASIGNLRESLGEMSGVAPVDLVLIINGHVRDGQRVSLRACGVVAGGEIGVETVASLIAMSTARSGSSAGSAEPLG